MKDFSRICLALVFVLAMILVVVSDISCLKTCSGNGKLDLKNTSSSTTQRIMIDGVSYGSIGPGESKSISLAAGHHNWQLVGISGGSGCTAAEVTIVECETSSYYCSGK